MDNRISDKWEIKKMEILKMEDNTRKLYVEYLQDSDTQTVLHTVVAELPMTDCPRIERHLYSPFEIGYCGKFQNDTVDFGFGSLHLITHDAEIIKRKTKEMTLEEIEKALGHKVKIVNSKEK